MKRILTTLALLAALAAACSPKVAPTGNSTGNTASAAPGGGGVKLSPMSELVVGTLKLDGTGQAVTKEQAAELLPLWQVYKGLMSSDTAAQAEIDGLTEQIHEAMTADQLKAIGDMKLTQGDVFAFMREQGGFGPSTQGQGTRRSSGQNNSGGQGGFAGGPPGGFAGGGPGGGEFPGGGFGGGLATGTRVPNGTAVARVQNPNRVPASLIEALIQYLQKIAGV